MSKEIILKEEDFQQLKELSKKLGDILGSNIDLLTLKDDSDIKKCKHCSGSCKDDCHGSCDGTCKKGCYGNCKEICSTAATLCGSSD